MSNGFQNRLNGLAMLTVNKNIRINPEDMIDDLLIRLQKLDFILQLFNY